MATTDIIDNVISQPKSRELVRRIIPILIRWAKNGYTDRTYRDMIRELGYTQFSGIGRQLGNVDDVMQSFSEYTGEKLPTLNALCKDAKTKLPSDGFKYVYKTYEKMNDVERHKFVLGLNSEAINYEKWDWVLASLGLETSKPFTPEEVSQIKKAGHSYGSGGEGPQHKALKEFILNNPESIKIKKVISKEVEHPLPSGDRLDVYFETEGNRHIAIEVKSSISSEEDITRGIFQCVKYKAILKALRQVESGNYDFDAILVTEGILSSENVKLANELGIVYIDGFKK